MDRELEGFLREVVDFLLELFDIGRVYSRGYFNIV